MRAFSLFRAVTFTEVAPELTKRYPEHADAVMLEGYANAYAALRLIEPLDTDWRLILTTVPPDLELEVESYVDVGALDPAGEEFGIDFSPWPEILGMRISADSMVRYPKAEIAAHLLWELTFYGFSDGEAQAKLEQLATLEANPDFSGALTTPDGVVPLSTPE